jgi:hypothetical protein
MPKPVVTILGVNVTDKVQGLPTISETKEFNFQKLTNNTYTFDLTNSDGEFGLQNSESIFSNVDWYGGNVSIDGWSGQNLWTGSLIDVAPNYAVSPPRTSITTKSVLYTFKDINISYKSSDWETPAETFKNICDENSFTNYNSASVTQSKSIFEANSCYWKVEIDSGDGQAFQSALEKIAEYSNSRLYNYLGNLYFRHWTPYTGGASIFIKEKNIISKPVLTNSRENFYNQYNIGYIGGVVTDTDGLGETSRRKYGTVQPGEFSTGSTDEMIYFKDEPSAKYIGNSIIQRGHKNLSTNPALLAEIICGVDYEFHTVFNVDSYVKLSFKNEGWNEKLFEITSYNINENNKSLTFTGLEVAQ